MKRLGAAFLAFLMCVSLMADAAYAEETIADGLMNEEIAICEEVVDDLSESPETEETDDNTDLQPEAPAGQDIPEEDDEGINGVEAVIGGTAGVEAFEGNASGGETDNGETETYAEEDTDDSKNEGEAAAPVAEDASEDIDNGSEGAPGDGTLPYDAEDNENGSEDNGESTPTEGSELQPEETDENAPEGAVEDALEEDTGEVPEEDAGLTDGEDGEEPDKKEKKDKSLFETIAEAELETIKIINPIYDGIIPEDVIPDGSADSLLRAGGSLDSVIDGYDVYDDIYTAGAVIKDKITKRINTIEFVFRSASIRDAIDLAEEIYSVAAAHTGVPDEGDYIRFEYGGYGLRYSDEPITIEEDDAYYYYYVYYPAYYTTARQETEMTSVVSFVLGSLDLDGKSDYQKISAIYKYLCDNVAYDYAHMNDTSYVLQFTGYAALVNHVAVCQGYSAAFYRLCLTAGIDARVISSNAICHAWNIARLGGNYYELDSTWDAGKSEKNYDNFLKGSKSWKASSHRTLGDQFNNGAFSAAYPVPTEDFSLCSTGNCADLEHVDEIPATCTEAGTAEYWKCRICGKIYLSATGGQTATEEELAIAPAGHDYQNGKCSRCGGLITYHITYELNGGTYNGTLPEEYTAETPNITLPAPEKTGYRFDGWFKEADFSGEAVSVFRCADASDITVYAKWSLRQYTILFDGNGCTSGSMEPVYKTIADDDFTVVNAYTWDKGEFTAWNTAPNGKGKTFGNVLSAEELLPFANGDTITLYAQWKEYRQDYNIAFDGNGAVKGKINAKTNLSCSKEYTLPANTFTGPAGYHFAGWALTPEGAVEFKDKGKVKNLGFNGETITLFAVWEENTYTVTFSGNGGKSGKLTSYKQTLTFGVEETLEPCSFEKTGYTFIGWGRTGKEAIYTDVETAAFNLTDKNKGSVTLYAVWKVNTYSIQFESDGVYGVMDEMTAEYGKSVRLPAYSETKPGYTFKGWEYNGKKYANKASVKNLTDGDGDTVVLNAVWEPFTYTLKFNMNGGKAPDSKIFAQQKHTIEDSTYIPGAPPVFSGYDFAGWCTAKDGSGELYRPGDAFFADGVKNNMAYTLYAVWYYTVTLNAGAGTDTRGSNDPVELRYNVNETVTAEEFSRTGYYLAGWNITEAAAAKGTVKYKVNAVKNAKDGTVLYAVWKPVTYQVRFNANNGTGKTKLQTLTYDKTVALVSNSFSVKGYKFLGWALTPGGAPLYANREKVMNLTASAGAVIDLYAVWG